MASIHERACWGWGIFLTLAWAVACGSASSAVGGESHFVCQTNADCASHSAGVCVRTDPASETGECRSAGDSATTQQAIMTRWNDAADAAGTSIDFHWPSFTQFPHPTFKMGSEQAYQEFASVLLLFFQSADNFDFLAQNQLFETPLRNVFPSGQVGMETTFKKLTTDFSSDTGFPSLPASTRQAFMSFLDRM